MITSNIDVTAIVNLHAEGMIAYSALSSVARAKSYAESRGVRVEVLVVLDCPSNATIDFIENCSLVDLTPIRVSFGDLGRARNAGVEAAKGEWISFLDGDDLWSENWLEAAYNAGVDDIRPIVWHPLALIVFGSECHLFVHVDSEDEDFDPLSLSMSNLWASQSFAKRQHFLSVPYPMTNFTTQLGYEDWGWNLETFSKGYLHKCVPDTIGAYRKRSGSLLKKTSTRKAMPKPTNLFREMILNRTRIAQR